MNVGDRIIFQTLSGDMKYGHVKQIVPPHNYEAIVETYALDGKLIRSTAHKIRNSEYEKPLTKEAA